MCRRLSRLLPQVVLVQKIHNVGKGRRCDIVKQRAQTLRGVLCKVPDDCGCAEAVQVSGIRCFAFIDRAGGILAAAVHTDLPQAQHGRGLAERRKNLRQPAIARNEFHEIPSFTSILPEMPRACKVQKTCRRTGWCGGRFEDLGYRMTRSPFCTSTVMVSPGRMLPSRIFFAISVSTVCWIYRRSGRAPNCGS